jgi:hypothetical protein
MHCIADSVTACWCRPLSALSRSWRNGFHRGVFPGLFVSGFLAAPIMRVCVCGVCGLGLLFENYIVDASIFYKKQFPRI